MLPADHGGGVGTDTHEEGMAEGNLTSDAGEQVEPEGGDGEDHRLGHDAQPVGVAEIADERDLIDHRQVERQQARRGSRKTAAATRCVHVGRIDVSDW